MVIRSEITVQPEDEEEDELILLFAEDLGINATTNEKIIPPPIRLCRLGEVAGRWTVTPLPKMIQLGQDSTNTNFGEFCEICQNFKKQNMDDYI